MVDLYNNILEIVSNSLDKFKTSEFYKNTKESLSSNLDINGMIKNIEKEDAIKRYIYFVKNANNNNSIKINFMGDVYSLDFEKRRKIVYYFIGGLLIRHLLKTKYFRRFLFNYIILSAMFCRENFDLKNYKIKPWERQKSEVKKQI